MRIFHCLSICGLLLLHLTIIHGQVHKLIPLNPILISSVILNSTGSGVPSNITSAKQEIFEPEEDTLTFESVSPEENVISDETDSISDEDQSTFEESLEQNPTGNLKNENSSVEVIEEQSQLKLVVVEPKAESSDLKASETGYGYGGGGYGGYQGGQQGNK